MNCIHCHQPIRWCKHAEKWFHIGNLTTFCMGMIGEKVDGAWISKSEKAEPTVLGVEAEAV